MMAPVEGAADGTRSAKRITLANFFNINRNLSVPATTLCKQHTENGRSSSYTGRGLVEGGGWMDTEKAESGRLKAGGSSQLE